MTRLTILHTNDIHGRVEQLTRIAGFVRRIRREVEAAGGHCIYVDAGDSEDTTLLESSLTKGSSMNAMLRGAGCDYVALGNAIPLRYGPQAIANMAHHLGQPLLCANFCDEHGNLVAGLKPFTVHEFNPLKLGIIGLTAPISAYASFFKIRSEPFETILPGLIEKVKAQGATTVLLISHLASDVDQKLAEKIPGVDIVVGAHDHKQISPPLKINDTLIVQAGEYGQFLGRLDLDIDPASGRITHYEGTLLPINQSLPPDPEAIAAVDAERVRVQSLMSRVVGKLSAPFDLADDRECAAGNLLADALLDRMQGAELAFVLAGQWQTGLESGPLTQGALFAANRSTANPGKVELTGAQIEGFLKNALKPENASQAPHFLRGRKMGLAHVAGMTVRYDPADMETLEVQVGNQPLDKERKYIVATTDMEVSDVHKYLVVPDELMEYEVPTIMPEVLEEYISKNSPISLPKSGRLLTK